MDINQLNKAIAACNPYDQKELRKYLVGLRRKLLKKSTKYGLAAMLQKQCGL